ILGFSILTNKISMATENSRMLVNMIPYSFLFPETPEFGILTRVILQAMSLSLVSSFLLVSLGKKIASFHNYRTNSNQDLIAIGLCNVVSSFFRSCVFTGAMARTIIQNKSGGRQQFASLVGAGVMVLLMVKMGSFFHNMPNAVLAGIILSNVIPYLETIYNLPSLWRQDQYDCVVWMVTFSAAIFLGLDVGLLISLVFAFFVVTVRSHRTKILILGQIPNTNIYRNVNDYREVVLIPGVKILQCCTSLTFVNVYSLKQKLLKEVNMVKTPLKEEEIFTLFNESQTSVSDNKVCRCFCDCEELEPETRVVYTERYETKQEQDRSSINLIGCSYLSGREQESETTSDEQIPHTVSSTSQKNLGQSYEDTEKAWVSNNPSRNSSLTPHETSESLLAQSRSRSVISRYTDLGQQTNIHTIVLDFSMVHYVDSRALVVLRQMCNAFYNANILVLISGCHTSVVKSFEKNDFFDKGITKAQLFLSLHDAILFASSRKNPEPSELSVDATETVIQETYSESDKNGNLSSLRYKTGSSIIEGSQRASPNFVKTYKPIKDDSEFDLEPMLNSEQNSDLGLSLDLDLNLDQESELESEIQAKSDLETELDTDAQTEPEMEEELEPEREPERERKPQPRTKKRAQSPWRNYFTAYRFGASGSQSPPQTRTVERK
ncbi:hypothetical protein STEG23_008110, partial [Scotinomys teguina]